MPRARGEKRYINLLKGLNTEESPLAFPADATTDEVNMTIDTSGRKRVRRKGIEQEVVTSLGTGEADMTDKAMIAFEWRNVANDPNIAWGVVQGGDWLNFIDISDVDPANNPGNFSYNLNQHAINVSVQSGLLEGDRVQMTSINGSLIVVGQYIRPFRLEYDPDAGTMTGYPIEPMVRDTEGLDDSLRIDERPASLSEAHEYNLYNQGWYEHRRLHGGGGTYTNPVTDFFASQAVYPSNSDIVYAGTKVDGAGDYLFDPKTMVDKVLGNSYAPRGHYVLAAFLKDRESKRTTKGNSGATSGINAAIADDVIRPVL